MEKIKDRAVKVSSELHFELRKLSFWARKPMKQIIDGLIEEAVKKDRRERGLDE